MRVKVIVGDKPDSVQIVRGGAFDAQHNFSTVTEGIYKSHDDAMTVAWLMRDIMIDEGDRVNLIYNW